MPDTATIREILEKTTAFFASKGIGSPRLDADVLLCHVLDCPRLQLYLDLERPLSEDELERARALVRRRAAHEPIAYIIGVKEFAGRDFKVGPGVLIPRPDTEILVEQVGRLLLEKFGSEEGPLRILEFGIGSGTIAVSLLADIPNLHVTATEIVPEAAEIARYNSAQHGVADRLEIRMQPNFTGITGPFHALVSNPPYVDPADKPTMAPDVRDYEPAEALFAEEAGLHWYPFLTAQAPALLVPGGFLAVEMGFNQGADVTKYFEQAGLQDVQVIKDYARHDRVVIGHAGR